MPEIESSETLFVGESGKTIPAVISKEDFDKLTSNFDKNLMSLTMKEARKLILKLEEFLKIESL